MTPAGTRETSAVWATLMVATLGSYCLAEYLGQPSIAVAAIILVAAFKVRLILRHFMELKAGPLTWRLFFDAWIGVCAALIIGLYFYAPG